MAKSDADVTLVTGFPLFTAKRMVRKLLEADGRDRVYLLVRAKFRAAAEEFLRELDERVRKRVTLLEGDICDMDLGLAGAEYQALAAELTAIHHLAAIYYLGVARDTVERVNVEGT